MRVYRLARQKYVDDLSGTGAALFDYRWNSKGIKMVYTAQSRALAMAEVAVHLNLFSLPEDYMMITLELPDELMISELDLGLLNFDWKTFPHSPKTQEMGDAFIRKGETCAFKVPSAVVKGDFNYLLNPQHPEMRFAKIFEVEPFPFDRRLFP
ncbi:RES family NAD+ phosphorylase [Vitellibacter sp. q18]|nr:RES family NAD+ phosphorylase [Aequorivita lutea]